MNNQKEAVKLYEPKVVIAGNTLPSHEIDVLKLIAAFLINKLTQQIHNLPDDADYFNKAGLLMGKRRKVLTVLELLEGGWDYDSQIKDSILVINDEAVVESDLALLRNGCEVFQRECLNSVHQKTACRLLNQLTPKG